MNGAQGRAKSESDWHERNLWKHQYLTADTCPAYPYVICKKGSLVLIKDSLRFKEDADSVNSHEHEAFDWDWISYTFTAWAQCTHPQCKQEYAFSGVGGIEPQMNEKGEFVYEEYFLPKSCYPMPDIIEFPPKCPEDVIKELRSAFAIFWINDAACASRLRVALELLMTHLGVPKSRQGISGKLSEMTLHDRIDAFAQKETPIGTQLMALKWLGNTGSHDSKVKTDDLLDAFEILEYALKEIIVGQSARVAELAKKLIKEHGGKKT